MKRTTNITYLLFVAGLVALVAALGFHSEVLGWIGGMALMACFPCAVVTRIIQRRYLGSQLQSRPDPSGHFI